MNSFQAAVALIVEVIVAHRVIAFVVVVALVVVNCVMVAEIFVWISPYIFCETGEADEINIVEVPEWKTQ